MSKLTPKHGLFEVRMYETIETGKPTTDFMKHGDTVKIYMNDKEGKSIFGEIFNGVRADI